MIQQILTDDGLCWAIVLDPTQSIENLINLKYHLTRLLIMATQSDLYDTSQDEFCTVLTLINEISPSQEQIDILEKNFNASIQIK